MDVTKQKSPSFTKGLSSGKIDRKSTRLNSSHLVISYAVFCLKKKNTKTAGPPLFRHQRLHPPRHPLQTLRAAAPVHGVKDRHYGLDGTDARLLRAGRELAAQP